MGHLRLSVLFLCGLCLALAYRPAHARLPAVDEILDRASQCSRPSGLHDAILWGRSSSDNAVRSIIRVTRPTSDTVIYSHHKLTPGTPSSAAVDTRYAINPQDDAVSLNRAPLWLQWWAGVPVREIAAAAKLAMTRTAFDHLDGVVLWVLGGAPGARTSPSLAFERDSGCLRRITLPTAEDKYEVIRLDLAPLSASLALLPEASRAPVGRETTLKTTTALSASVMSVERPHGASLSYHLQSLRPLRAPEPLEPGARP